MTHTLSLLFADSISRQSNGQRTCGWILRKSFIDAAGLGGLACTGTAVSGGGGVAVAPATNAPTPATEAPVTAAPVTAAPTAAPVADDTTAAPVADATPAATDATTAAVDQKAACLATISGTADADFICDELVRVNVYRAEHGANPLT